MYRGELSNQEVDEIGKNVQADNSDTFVEWIPNNLKTSIVSIPPSDSPISATCVTNSTALKSIFQRLSQQFGQLYKKKAFLHWYKNEGMDE
eukprot:UN33079